MMVFILCLIVGILNFALGYYTAKRIFENKKSFIEPPKIDEKTSGEGKATY